MRKKAGLKKKSEAQRKKLRQELARIRELIEQRVEKEVSNYREYMQLRLDSRDAFINMLC